MQQSSNPLRLLIVDDDDDLRDLISRRFQHTGAQVTEAGDAQEALEQLKSQRFDVALLDITMPGMDGIELLGILKEEHPEVEALMLTAHGTIESAIQAMKLGAYDYLIKPIRFQELELRAQKAFDKACLARQHRQWSEHLRYEHARYQLIGSSSQMQKLIRMIQKVAPSEATILIRGESGTGKELVARALHTNSPRSSRPMVTINCAALQESLLESELFGHEKGSFTGATQAKPGLFEVAEGGALFVDEIGEMAPGLQAKLLRVLEDGHYRKVGGTQELHADVRVIAATNRDLEKEMKEGHFREDLYYRLNVVTITLPPLRERKEDIPELVDHFLKERAVGGMRFQISNEVLQVLSNHNWPGNIRELANVLERAQILAEDQMITLDDLPDTLTETQSFESTQMTSSSGTSLREAERLHVKKVLKQVGGNKVQAAKALGISRRSLYRLLEKHQLGSSSDNSTEI